jgi:hypothetical protein
LDIAKSVVWRALAYRPFEELPMIVHHAIGGNSLPEMTSKILESPLF